MSREIKLTRGYTAIIDDEDFEKVSQHSWCYSGEDNKGYAMSFIEGKHTYLHHFLIGNPLNGHHTDHENRNSLDYQKLNLRHKTHGANLRNNSSLGVGISRRGKFVAHIKYKGVMQHKTFNTLQEAKDWRAMMKKHYDQ